MTPELEVTILNRQRGRAIRPGGLKGFLERLISVQPPRQAHSVTVCLVSDRRMGELNRRYRQRVGATDVLSFLGDDEPDPEGRVHLGDIVISVPTAARQARRRKHSLVRELKILLLHGYLHLLGHDHATDNGGMLRLEARLKRRLLPPPAARRA